MNPTHRVTHRSAALLKGLVLFCCWAALASCSSLGVTSKLTSRDQTAALLMVESTITDTADNFLAFKLSFDDGDTVMFRPKKKFNYIRQLGVGDHVLRRIDIVNESTNTVDKSFTPDLKFRLESHAVTVFPVKITMDLRQVEAYKTVIYYGFGPVFEDDLAEYLEQAAHSRPEGWSIQEFQAAKRKTPGSA